MMKSRGLRGRKGISPVIATVILVAVAITVAVSVAFWMGGITGQYTRFEKLQVLDPVIDKGTGEWNLTFTIKNTGASDATINDVLINGVSYSSFSGIDVTDPTGFSTNGLPITSGSTDTLTLNINASSSGLSAGTTIEVKFRSASGSEYPKMVTLP